MRIGTHLTIDETEAKLLDEILEQTPFESRTDFLTACVHVLLYGERAECLDELDPITTKWAQAIQKIANEETKIREGFFSLIHEIGFPVLAMRGRKALFRGLKNEFTQQMMERYGAAPNHETMEEWIKIFEELHIPEINAHRNEVLKEHYLTTGEVK